jgi:hypothetical protein
MYIIKYGDTSLMTDAFQLHKFSESFFLFSRYARRMLIWPYFNPWLDRGSQLLPLSVLTSVIAERWVIYSASSTVTAARSLFSQRLDQRLKFIARSTKNLALTAFRGSLDDSECLESGE